MRLNNPGNIRRGAKWLGLANLQDDPDFCRFIDVEHGIRAMAVILHNYAGKKVNTVREIVSRWAPPSENATAAYIKAVDAAVPGGPDDELDLGQPGILHALIGAIIHQEQGFDACTDAQIDAGIKLALQ